jgi:arsenical pump membrane protein
MFLTLSISGATIICLVLSIVKYPYIKIKERKIQSFFLVTSMGAIILLLFNLIGVSEVTSVLFSNTPLNPLKILVLFISVSILSIALDEVGFFSYLANQALKLGKKNQTTLFVVLYAVISILTVFTSNDILILTFTPFICAFAKRANINPIPYLVAEFVSANTFSMMLSIGNPTNIYISSVYGISFFEYLKVMFVPTVFAGMSAFLLLFLLLV